MIEDFVDSVLIIDDLEKDVVGLKSVLDSKQILYNHLLPASLLDDKIKLKNRKLIFLDLYVDESKATITEQLSIIRRIFTDSIGKEFGTYGLILWTKHPDQFIDFKEKFYKSFGRYQLPMFTVSLDKSKYLKDGFDNLFMDLESSLVRNPSSNFFINWEILVRKSKDLTIESIYNLVNKNHNSIEENLRYVLFQLARNYTGIPFDKLENYNLEHDAVKSFSDLLIYNVSNSNSNLNDLFKDWEQITFKGQESSTIGLEYNVRNFSSQSNEKKEILKGGGKLSSNEKKTFKNEISNLESEIEKIQSEINCVMLIDSSNLDHFKIFPGNIYEIISNKDYFVSEDLPDSAMPVLIEVTPPCDFSNNKLKKRRVVSGFVLDYDREIINNFKADCYYREIYPISINNVKKAIIFDFRYFGSIDEKEILNKSKYKLLFRVKDKLFADIIQKLSSHTARLGLAILH